MACNDFPNNPVLDEIYNTGTQKYRWDGAKWVPEIPVYSGGSGWDPAADPDDIVNTNSGNVGIGTDSPERPLTVAGVISARTDIDDAAILLSPTSTENVILSRAGNSSAAALPLVFRGGAADRMVIDAAGNVGIGATDVPARLTVEADTVLSASFESTGTQNAICVSDAGSDFWYTAQFGTKGNDIYFATGGLERMHIGASGNVGIGTDDPLSPFVVSNGGAEGAEILFENGDVRNLAYDRTGAALTGVIHDASQVVFRTSAALPVVERMRIDSSGALILAGSTAQKATGTTWSNPSDVRLKDNITDYAKGSAELMQIQVREWDYNGKANTTDGMRGLGVIADEVMKILPDTVTDYEAKLNPEDKETTSIKQFDATEITWLLVKTVQELTARLEALEGA